MGDSRHNVLFSALVGVGVTALGAVAMFMRRRQLAEPAAPALTPILGPVRVHYWAGRGRMEPIRLLLAAGGVPFENVFIHTAEDFKALCDSERLMYDQVPLVEMDGINLVQSGAISNYIARRLGMYPAKLVDQLAVDELCASAVDARAPLMGFPWGQNKEKIEQAFNESYWRRWEREIPELGSFFLGPKLCLADVAVFEVLDFYEQIFGGEFFLRKLEPCPKLLRLYRKVCVFGDIAKHRASREAAYLPLAQYAKEVEQTLGITIPRS